MSVLSQSQFQNKSKIFHSAQDGSVFSLHVFNGSSLTFRQQNFPIKMGRKNPKGWISKSKEPDVDWGDVPAVQVLEDISFFGQARKVDEDETYCFAYSLKGKLLLNRQAEKSSSLSNDNFLPVIRDGGYGKMRNLVQMLKNDKTIEVSAPFPVYTNLTYVQYWSQENLKTPPKHSRFQLLGITWRQQGAICWENEVILFVLETCSEIFPLTLPRQCPYCCSDDLKNISRLFMSLKCKNCGRFLGNLPAYSSKHNYMDAISLDFKNDMMDEIKWLLVFSADLFLPVFGSNFNNAKCFARK